MDTSKRACGKFPDVEGSMIIKMKRVIITQRVDEISSYGEIRDSLDQKWYQFFGNIGGTVIPMPNYSANVQPILQMIKPQAIVLSGGGNPVAYGGKFAIRDEVDDLLIEYAIDNRIPLLGVCRGMQSIALHFGGKLERIDYHVAVKHMVTGETNREVNSFHGYAVAELPPDLEAVVYARDGVIEGIKHKKHRIYGIMWHPERVAGFDKADERFVKQVLDL